MTSKFEKLIRRNLNSRALGRAGEADRHFDARPSIVGQNLVENAQVDRSQEQVPRGILRRILSTLFVIGVILIIA